DAQVIKTWFVTETFRLEDAADGTVLLRSAATGQYAALDADGTVRVTAERPEDAESWQREVLRDGRAEAVAAAADADLAIVVLGNHPLIHGRETEDRKGTALPPAQDDLLRAVTAVRPQTALVLMSSYPYAVDWADERLPAVLWTSHGGQEAGAALADVLLGHAEPGGRLPQTWYRGDDPLPHPLDYDIIKAGWTYQYHRSPALYPFGHGLSYAAFEYGDLTLSQPATGQDGTVQAALTVRNTGRRAGSEVLQLYVRALDARYQAPRLRLADFRKVRLEPGESRELVFELPASALAHWDVATGAFTVDPGDYEVIAARSAEHPLAVAPLAVTGTPAAPRAVVEQSLAAVDFDDHTGIAIVDADKTRGDAVTPADPAAGAVLSYRALDLTGAARIEAGIAREDTDGTARLVVEAGGRVLADIDVPATGDRYTWTTAAAPLTHRPDGIHELRLHLHGAFRLGDLRFGRTD
ncbi:glycoside hydrolase family 3 C-terminal domain-containing protein, partial [Kitasatospora sp. NPDC049285]|uniref:glycoside hydrolase family 3 C-terminal domain-containing protein n=1 Tax=Kitasatospora sp. NPDC049285 TaxID=3157096 RepID=UPI00343EDEE2